jgi:hypothetical protein
MATATGQELPDAFQEVGPEFSPVRLSERSFVETELLQQLREGGGAASRRQFGRFVHLQDPNEVFDFDFLALGVGAERFRVQVADQTVLVDREL